MMDWIFDRYSAISYSLLIALTAGALSLIGAASVIGLVISLIFFGIFLFGVYELQQKGSGIRATFPSLPKLDSSSRAFAPNSDNIFGKTTTTRCPIRAINAIWCTRERGVSWLRDR